MKVELIRDLVCLGLAAGSSAVVWSLLRIPALQPPGGGIRGLKRAALMQQGSLLLHFEPLLLKGGGWVAELLPELLRLVPSLKPAVAKVYQSHEQMLRLAGQPGGLEVHAFWALCLGTGSLGGAVALCLGQGGNAGAFVLPAILLGLCLPGIRVASMQTDRQAAIAREIPVSIDLAALSMNAGSDFTGALRRVTEGQTGAVAEELRLVLASIDLGVSRAHALRALELRAPVVEVRDLVRAVVLAEQKGASLAEAMAQLAVSSRQRRSVRAEEAAARAGVLLMAPIMLLVVCVMILLLGPLLSGGVGI